MNRIPRDLPGGMAFSPDGDGSARRLFPFKFSMDSLGTPFSSERVSATPRRLNLLFSATWREGGPTAELPRLLDPLGVRCLEARCGRDAARLVEQEEIHIALIDLELPMEANGDKRAAGEKVLQLLRSFYFVHHGQLVVPLPQLAHRALGHTYMGPQMWFPTLVEW